MSLCVIKTFMDYFELHLSVDVKGFHMFLCYF